MDAVMAPGRRQSHDFNPRELSLPSLCLWSALALGLLPPSISFFRISGTLRTAPYFLLVPLLFVPSSPSAATLSSILF